MALPEPDDLRREAIGAFVHEMRTPLTSLRMVLEVARRGSNGPGVVLDDELVTMVEDAIGHLQALADDLQETSRLERGKIAPSPVPCSLHDLLARLTQVTPVELDLRVETAEVQAEWDIERLAGAMVAFVEAAKRCGNGDSNVACVVGRSEASCVLRFSSGTRQGAARPVNSDLGFGFFQACTLVRAMGGSIDVDRTESYCEIQVALPA